MRSIPNLEWRIGQLVRLRKDFDEDPPEELTAGKLYAVEDPPFEHENFWFIGIRNDAGYMSAYLLDRFTMAYQTSDAGADEYAKIMAAQEAIEGIIS
jgi:hypothetical protein